MSNETEPGKINPEKRSMLSQAVETQLLPIERFKDNVEGTVVDIKKIDEAVGILCKFEDHFTAYFFDGKGNLSKTNLDPSSHDLAENTRYQYIPVNEDNQHTGEFNTIVERLGFTRKTTHDKLRKEWMKKVTNKARYGSHTISSWGYMLPVSTVKGSKEVYLPLGQWVMEIKIDEPGNKYFVFSCDDIHFFTNPTELVKKTISHEIYTHLKDPNTNLFEDMVLEEDVHFFKIKDKNGKELASFSGSKPKADPKDASRLYFINSGRIYSLDLKGVAGRTSSPIPESQVRVDNPEEIDFDPNVNFFIVKTYDKKVVIIDKESGEVVREFTDAAGPILVDRQGDILYIDTQNKLREIQTNFQAIPSGGSEAANAKREEQLKKMQERFASLQLGKVQKQNGGVLTEEDVANTLRETISNQIGGSLTSNSAEKLEEIMDWLQSLKADPQNKGYGEVVDEFVAEAREKLSVLRTGELDQKLTEYEKSLEGVENLGDTIGLDEEFAKLLDFRQKTDITDPAVRRNLEQRLRRIQTQKDILVEKYQKELLDAIEHAFPEIEQLINETGSSQEMAMFNTTVEAQRFEMMLSNVRDPKIRKELRDRLNTAKAEQRSRLEAKGKQLEEEQRLRWAQVIEEAKEELETLRNQIAEISESREVDRFERNPLVTAWKAKIFALPPELREIEEKKLEVILGSRKKDIEHRKQLGAVGEGGELKFGKISFPIYKEPPRIWRPVLLPIEGVMPDYADLAFQDEQGRIWHPDQNHPLPVIADLSFEQTSRLVEKYTGEAEKYFKSLTREVPEYNDRWKISRYQMEKLEEIAESLNIQAENQMGITILEGEAGTGKNVLVDILANLSNKEVVTIACNEKTAKEDLTYEFYYDPERGTYKLPSRLVDALKRPGVIILFDEINTVKAGIVKMLNPLFDYRRKLVANEGGVQYETRVDVTTLLMGTMNPQDYAGVDRLAETILSRSDIIEIKYPPFEFTDGGRTRYRSDEGEMLYSYVHVLESLQQKEFKLAWDFVVNKDKTNGGELLLQTNPDLENGVRRLYDSIRVANRLREMYSSYQIGDSNEPMDFTTSLREMVNISLRMNHSQNISEVVKRVILPKIGDRRQRVLVGQTIEAVLPSNP